MVGEIRAAGGEAIANADSVATRAGAEGLVAAAVKHFGKVDVMIDNAGILRDKTLLKMDDAMWDAVIAVHLTGSFLCTQAAATQMRAQGTPGSIVNTTSVSGMLGNFGQANYSAAKAGIYGLTRTAWNRAAAPWHPGQRGGPHRQDPHDRRSADVREIQSMTPEHVAPARLFLASPLSGDLTGAVLSVASRSSASTRSWRAPASSRTPTRACGPRGKSPTTGK